MIGYDPQQQAERRPLVSIYTLIPIAVGAVTFALGGWTAVTFVALGWLIGALITEGRRHRP